MDIVMVKGTEELYDDLIQDGWKEQDYRIAGNSYIRRV